ncbi:hypothetical protein SYNPS1DRAFT_24865 [Syncephalis pseudoplumigaleata]|uniref:Uncharacterized protein n=1 Tax=Syncephalis pseudoplumigaleata TaxID=1712513 RepID=A0A4P9YTT3_9FUNG|nr:hypothetical protein SYNPS1DRAFT_24865 [Syncephalis pseudoplumigaleata]|eukprot:RKP23148.1 hypothetical protein SYNPS1DRAFT_24865 [Syncephalis pseudoplumigaleata]
MNADSHRRRRQSADVCGAATTAVGNGARSDGEYSSAQGRRGRARDTAHFSPGGFGRPGQRTLAIAISNRHPEVELRTLYPCVLSGTIASGRLPSNSLGSGDRREVVYATEPVHHDGPAGETREETRGAFIYQLRGRRGMPLSRRLFLFIAWSVPGSGPCRCMAQVVEADHCTFPDEPAETRGQFRRLTRQRMGSTGGVRIERRRHDTTSCLSEASSAQSSQAMRAADQGAYSDGEAVLSTAHSSKRQPARHRERYRYVLDEDRVAFTVVSWMEAAAEGVELRVDVVDEAFDGYGDPKTVAKPTSPIWLEALGEEGEQESGDESAYNDVHMPAQGDNDAARIASRMFRHVTGTPDSSIMAGSKDMTCVFRSGVLGASGIKGCLIYQIIPRAAGESMSIVQRQFLAIVWDVHSLLSTDSKSRRDAGRAAGRRLRAYVFTIDRPRFPHDRPERERFFRVLCVL